MSFAAKVVFFGIASLTMLGMVHAETAEQMLARGPHGRRLAVPTTADGWVKAGNICGAGEMANDQPPTTYICDCGSASMCSASYISQSVIGLALCANQSYGTSGTGCTMLEDTIAGTRRAYSSSNASAGAGNNYAVLSDGIGLGGPLAGGYVGTASYLVTQGEIKYNTNDFVVASSDGAQTYVAQMCVVPATDTTTSSFTSCGPNRTATPGAFKFSLYGYTWGSNYAAETAGKTFLVFRTKVCTKGMTEVKVNDVVNGTGVIGTLTQVTTVSVKQADGTVLSYAFPQKYLSGSTEDGAAKCTQQTTESLGFATFYKCTADRARTVKITAQSAVCGTGMKGIYVDYGFDTANDLNVKDRWFAYDPDIKKVVTSGTSTGGTSAGAGAGAAGTTGGSTAAKAEHITSISFFLLATLFAVAART